MGLPLQGLLVGKTEAQLTLFPGGGTGACKLARIKRRGSSAGVDWEDAPCSMHPESRT